MIFGNESLIESIGLKNESELIGKTDKDLFPCHIADKYREDDLKVIQSKKEMLNLVELFRNKQGLLKWFITHKYPLFNQAGEVIGIMGCVQDHEKMNDPMPEDEKDILAVSEYIKNNFSTPISLDKLSKLANIAPRKFQRKFKQYFNISPREYIIRHRIYYACEALRNSKISILDISHQAGFYDQSSFTNQFKKYTGVTPLKYRKRIN